MSDLFAALGRSSCQGAIVIAVVWLTCRLLERRLPASLRCTLWRLSYVKMLLSLVIAGGIALPLLRSAPALSETLPVFTATVPTDRSAAMAPPKVIGLPAIAASTAALNHDLRPNWLLLVGVAYIAGLAICLSRLVLAWTRARRLLRGAVWIIDAAYLAPLAELSAKIGLRAAPPLATSVEISGPTYVSGAILLPAGYAYEPDALRLILAHEIAHARRRDLVYEWLGVLTQTLFYFHPLVLLARREERLARESAADELALRATALPAATFGALLLELALKPRGFRTTIGAIGVLENGSLLHRRLVALKGVSTMSANRKLALLPLATLLLLVPWYVTRASSKPLAPNVDFIRHSAAFPKIPHGDHSIVGQVRDDGGNLPGDVIVGLFLLRKGESLESDSRGAPPSPMILIHADAAGEYVLSDLPAGHFGILVMDNVAWPLAGRDLRQQPSAVGRFAPASAEVTIKPEEKVKNLNLTVSRGVTISGRILDRASGLPIPNVLVVSLREGSKGVTEEGGDGAKTNPDGRYFLRVLPGRVSAAVISFGEVRVRILGKKFDSTSGQNVTYDFRVTAPPSS